MRRSFVSFNTRFVIDMKILGFTIGSILSVGPKRTGTTSVVPVLLETLSANRTCVRPTKTLDFYKSKGSDSSSHLPPEDRKARFSDEGRVNLRKAKFWVAAV